VGSHPREREAEKTKPRGERREHVDVGRRLPRSPATTPLRVRAAVPRVRRRGGRAAGRRAAHPPAGTSADYGAEAARLEDDAVGRASRRWPG